LSHTVRSGELGIERLPDDGDVGGIEGAAGRVDARSVPKSSALASTAAMAYSAARTSGLRPKHGEGPGKVVLVGGEREPRVDDVQVAVEDHPRNRRVISITFRWTHRL
jgi:hypothetical protein